MSSPQKSICNFLTTLIEVSKSRTGRDLVACGALTDSSLSSSPSTIGVRIHPLPCPSPSLGCGSCLQHGSPLLIGVWTPSPVSSLRATVVLRKIGCPEHSDVLVFQWFLWALRLLLPPPLTFLFFSIVCVCLIQISEPPSHRRMA